MADVSTANPQGLWQALVAAAVLGTDRAGKTPAIPQPIADVAKEGDFLAHAAAVCVYARAGATKAAAVAAAIAAMVQRRSPTLRLHSRGVREHGHFLVNLKDLTGVN